MFKSENTDNNTQHSETNGQLGQLGPRNTNGEELQPHEQRFPLIRRNLLEAWKIFL